MCSPVGRVHRRIGVGALSPAMPPRGASLARHRRCASGATGAGVGHVAPRQCAARPSALGARSQGSQSRLARSSVGPSSRVSSARVFWLHVPVGIVIASCHPGEAPASCSWTSSARPGHARCSASPKPSSEATRRAGFLPPRSSADSSAARSPGALRGMGAPVQHPLMPIRLFNRGFGNGCRQLRADGRCIRARLSHRQYS